MARVDVISSCLVGMATSAPSMSKLELTPWDLQLLLLHPIQKGLLFPKPQSPFIDHLKHSLSLTLDFFPPLAGRLSTLQNDDVTTSFFVDCNNAGVEFVHAVARSVSISDILEPIYIPEIVSSFFPLNGVRNCEGDSKPLLGVQLTELVDGVFIACTANHAVIDGISFWHFFNSWSEISRGFASPSKLPVFEPWFPPNLPNHNRLIHLPPFEKNQPQKNVPDPNQPQKNVPDPLLERLFHFSRETLTKLKARANSEAGTDKISSLQALSAYLWLNVTRCRHPSPKSSSEEAGFMIVVGGRTRINLPEGYFGNAAHLATTSIGVAELLQKGFGYAAVKINEFVAQQTDGVLIESMEKWVRNPELHQKATFPFSFAVTSSPRHNVYGNDFGWGKPVAVRSGKSQKFDGKLTLFPAADGGIDVEVCLAPKTLQAMADDKEFMEAFTR